MTHILFFLLSYHLIQIPCSYPPNLRLTYYYNTINTGYNYGVLSCINGICKIGDNQVTTDLKARLITGEEVSKLTVAAGAGSSTNAATWTVSSPSSKYYYFSNSTKVLGTTNTGTGSTTLSWPIENTTASTNSGATSSVYGGGTNYGYWSLSPTSNTNSSVWLLHYTGKFDWYSVGSGNYGIRPVITIPKSIFAS